jgi:hypothetical protein
MNPLQHLINQLKYHGGDIFITVCVMVSFYLAARLLNVRPVIALAFSAMPLFFTLAMQDPLFRRQVLALVSRISFWN